jgi:hypothetical protein
MAENIDEINNFLNLSVNSSYKNLPDIEKENIELINKEKEIRENFLKKIDINKDIVLIGSGPSLNEHIDRKVIKKIFNNISDNFYIAPINDKWVFCKEYDFSFCVDEVFLKHHIKYNGPKTMITGPYSYRIDYESRTQLASIPYLFYRKKSEKILCLFKGVTFDYHLRKYKYNLDNLNNLQKIKIVIGGSAAIEFFKELGFKNFYLIGFGGTGSTKLVSTIPLTGHPNHIGIDNGKDMHILKQKTYLTCKKKQKYYEFPTLNINYNKIKISKIYIQQPDSHTSTCRTFNLIKEGLETCEKIDLVDNPNDADFIFIHYAYGNFSFIGLDFNKIVFFDFNDSQEIFPEIKTYKVFDLSISEKFPNNIDKIKNDFLGKIKMYFKRSCVFSLNLESGIIKKINYPHSNLKSITHTSIMKVYKDYHIFTPHSERNIDIICSLRHNQNFPSRNNILDFMKEKFRNSKYNIIFKDFDGNSAYYYDNLYYESLRKSKIIITCNSTPWEGDNRLFESISSGALVFCDNSDNDYNHKFIDKKHIIYYKINNLDYLYNQINYYLENDKERESIAKNGYLYGLRYHTPLAKINDILNIIKE